LLAAAGILGALGSPAGPACADQVKTAPARVTPATSQVPLPRSIARLLGQRIMVGVSGTTADPGLLAQVREGHVGAVILFAANIVDRSQVRALTGALQHAARQGGNPALLIAIDQEGGQVKRFPFGPPFKSPPEMAQSGSAAVAFNQGRMTGSFLKARGINWNLAPVVDVPTYPSAFIWQQGRAFSFSANEVVKYASAFALGVQSAHAAATAKHFPGVGSAPIDTDNQLMELHPSRSQRASALKPYRALIPRGLDSIMLSTAGFPAYDPSGTPTALSRRMIQGLLRGQLRFGGVTITDSLSSPTGHDEITAGVLAARAGADVLLYTDSAPGELGSLESALRHGRLSRAEANASYTRIVLLKRAVAGS
jgi:beta-N-acetylhexosaminidase